jgi:hypothetical protein
MMKLMMPLDSPYYNGPWNRAQTSRFQRHSIFPSSRRPSTPSKPYTSTPPRCPLRYGKSPPLSHAPLLTRSRAFRNLPQRTRVGVGAALLAWGTAGLYLSDTAEKKLGLEPSEEDRAALDAVIPRITVVKRDAGKS